MPVRGIRAAIDVSEDRSEIVLTSTRELLKAILKAYNELRCEDITNAIFTTTEDLKSAYPAQAAREMGWKSVRCSADRSLRCQVDCRAVSGSGCDGNFINTNFLSVYKKKK